MLYRCRERLLGLALEIGPLLAAMLLSNPSQGRQFYMDVLLPACRTVVEAIIPRSRAGGRSNRVALASREGPKRAGYRDARSGADGRAPLATPRGGVCDEAFISFIV